MRRDVVVVVNRKRRHNRSPCATLCVVTTFITPFGDTSKRILKRIDVGEGQAMGRERPQMIAGDSR
jgi:hypothetical protein